MRAENLQFSNLCSVECISFRCVADVVVATFAVLARPAAFGRVQVFGI